MISLRDIAVMGGGWYGSFYLKQLIVARGKGALTFRRLLIVDSNADCRARAELAEGCELVVSEWNPFLDGYLGGGVSDELSGDDMVVPTPLMPHLMADWVVRRAKAEWPGRSVEMVPVDTPVGTPYDRLHTDGVRYVSFADWICPTHCVEPLLCPATGAPRTWEMQDTIAEWSERLSRDRRMAAPAFFQCAHVAYGVGMYSTAAAAEAFAELARCVADGAEGSMVVGSISACHGAVGVVRVGGGVESIRE